MLNQSVRRGIGLSILAMLCIAGMDATGKILTQTYPIVQIMAVRFGIFLAVAIAAVSRKGSLANLASKNVGIQILRSLLLVIEVSVFILAFSLMPLADVHAIAAVSPLIVTVLAGLFLRETVGTRGWVSVAIGFVGALIIIRPGMEAMSWHAVIPVCGAILWAGYQILSRHVAEFDRPETTVLYTASIGLMVFGILAPFYWVAPTPVGWRLLILNGVLGSTGHYILIKALDLAPASALQPFSYSLMIWAIVIGYFTFGDLPDIPTFLGAAIVIGAGIVSSGSGRLWVARMNSRDWSNR